VAVNSIYVSTILSYKYNLVLKSFSYGTQVMGHPVQGVSEISALILTGNRTHQKEQLFSLPFWRKTLPVHISKTKLSKNVKQPDSYEVDFLQYG
jgi:hypothetical protein